MKGLAGIRDAMWELLANESIHHSWDVICRRLLDKPLLFWEDLMQQLFLDRLQVRWETARSSCFGANPGVIFQLSGESPITSYVLYPFPALLTYSRGDSSG